MGNLFFDIEKEKEKEFDTIKFRNQRRNLRQLKQVGRSNASIDSKRDALLAGKRISKNGKTYWETRKNRSDAKDSNI
jgi:hypothetical protein